MSGGGRDEVRVKMLIIGESYVGKSSLLRQYVDEEFSQNHQATIGVEYKQKTLKTDSGQVRVQIWDTAGTTRYNTLTPNYYRNVDGILLVFDITAKPSFEMVSYWIKEINEKTDISRKDLLLVGNKTDLAPERTVSSEEGQKVADEIGIGYVETSAKTYQDTRVAFERMIEQILKRTKKLEPTDNKGKVEISRDPPAKKKEDCC